MGLLEQTKACTAQNDVLIARTLVNLTGNTVPLRVLNLSSQQRVFNKGTQLATCGAVNSIVAPGSQVLEVPPAGRIPTHLEDLFKRSVAELDDSESLLVSQLLMKFSDVFSAGLHDMGCTELIKHHIDTGSYRPIRQPPRRLPLSKREEAEKSIKEMLEQDVIEPSASPWSSPIVLVQKKDGTNRFCVDYRKLNDVTHKDSYPLPRIDDTLEALSGVKWFSTLDLRSGYWQVQLDKSSKEKTAFSTGSGLWQFKVMPFGLCNAPATFERLMEQVLVGLPSSIALVYLDDILVTGTSFSLQLANLE